MRLNYRVKAHPQACSVRGSKTICATGYRPQLANCYTSKTHNFDAFKDMVPQLSSFWFVLA